MPINHLPREITVRVLKNPESHTRAEIIKALYDIRYNTHYGGTEIVYPLLHHTDDDVVASALFTLWHGYGLRDDIEPFIRQFAKGDARDRCDMPIQTMGITLLAELAKTDATARYELLEIAEDAGTADVPRTEAWQVLADLYKVEWLSEYTEEMIMTPESEKSEAIRRKISQAIRG